MSEVIDGGLTFAGYLQPPDVPADPIGDAWRGITGPVGPQGPQGPPGTLTAASFPTSNAGLSAGAIWNNGGFLCVV